MGYLAKSHVRDACLDRIGLLPAGRVQRLEDRAERTDRVLIHDIRQFNGLMYTPQGITQPKHRVTPDDHGFLEEYACTIYAARNPDSHHYVIKREVDFEKAQVAGQPCFELCDNPPEQPLFTCLEVDCTDSCAAEGGAGVSVQICCPTWGPPALMSIAGEDAPALADSVPTSGTKPMAKYPSPLAVAVEGAITGNTTPAPAATKVPRSSCAEKRRRRQARAAMLSMGPVALIGALTFFFPAFAPALMPLFWGMIGAAVMTGMKMAGGDASVGILADTCEQCTFTVIHGSDCQILTDDCCIKLPGDVIRTSTFGKLCFNVNGDPTCFAVPLLPCADSTGTCDDPMRLINPGDCA